jgi:hypothetical protein
MCSHIRSSAPSAIVVSRAAQTADLAKMSTALLLCGASFVAHSEARCNSPEDGVAAAQQKANFAAASSQSGVWVQDMKRSESLGPFLSGLGMPWFVSPFVDGIATTLRVSACYEEGSNEVSVEIVDKTILGRNSTKVVLGGGEEEKATRTGRKKFMLSGYVDGEFTTVKCRLFQRGEGWHTLQERRVIEGGAVLLERNVLVRPGEADVTVLRYFKRTSEKIDVQTV